MQVQPQCKAEYFFYKLQDIKDYSLNEGTNVLSFAIQKTRPRVLIFLKPQESSNQPWRKMQDANLGTQINGLL